MPNASSRSRLQRGASFHRSGDARAATREYRQHLVSHPNDKLGYYHLALALQQIGQPEAAVHAYVKALEIDPHYPEALNNLGILLHKAGELDAARTCFVRALAARPHYEDAEYNYATVESDAGNYPAALLHFSRLLERNPKRATAWNNLAKVFLSLREPLEAKRACQIALSLDPDVESGSWNHSLASLTLGELPKGWAGYEVPPVFPRLGIPRWSGNPLGDRKLLIRSEQGLGDTIQFSRYCSHVRGDYTLECHSELHSLLAPIDAVGFGAELPNMDLQIPLMRLPAVFETTVATIPDRVPYLKADPALAADWKRRMGVRDHSLKVGLVWAGNPKHRNDRLRSFDPVLLKPLADLEFVSYFCLQQHPQSQAAYSHPVPFAGIFDRLSWPDTAAILMNLDLVISVDTAVVHLAGALARPVWTMLPYAPDWRWMLDRTDSPWYPTMRLFRQPRMGDWAAVIDDVRRELTAFASTS